MFRFTVLGISALLLASAPGGARQSDPLPVELVELVSEDPGIESVIDGSDTDIAPRELPPFAGRAGATKQKLIVTSCGVPASAAPEVAPPPREVVPAKPSVDEKLLRKLVQQGSSDWMMSKPPTKEELMKQVPPKYRELVERYFEQLERAQKK